MKNKFVQELLEIDGINFNSKSNEQLLISNLISNSKKSTNFKLNRKIKTRNLKPVINHKKVNSTLNSFKFNNTNYSLIKVEYKPNRKNLMINNIDIKNCSNSWRKMVKMENKYIKKLKNLKKLQEDKKKTKNNFYIENKKKLSLNKNLENYEKFKVKRVRMFSKDYLNRTSSIDKFKIYKRKNIYQNNKLLKNKYL